MSASAQPAHTPRDHFQLAAALYGEPEPASSPPTVAEHPHDFATRYAEHMAASRTEKPAPDAPALQADKPAPSEPVKARSDQELAEAFYGPEVNLDHVLPAAEREVQALDTAGRTTLQAKAYSALVREYGEERAVQALDAARALARSQPGLQDRLNSTGAGDHPSLVLQLARDGLKQRAQGRLK